MMNKYALFFRDIYLGDIIIKKDSDFPSLLGEFISANTELPEQIRNYIKYSIGVSRLLAKDEAEGIRFLAENESQFQELIDSQEWYLLDEAGAKEAILIPIFEEDGVTCRWNFTKGQP